MVAQSIGQGFVSKIPLAESPPLPGSWPLLSLDSPPSPPPFEVIPAQPARKMPKMRIPCAAPRKNICCSSTRVQDIRPRRKDALLLGGPPPFATSDGATIHRLRTAVGNSLRDCFHRSPTRRAGLQQLRDVRRRRRDFLHVRASETRGKDAQG